MLRSIKRYGVALLAAATVHSASAFSPGGPPADWQAWDIAYMNPGVDIVAPMNLGEGYRWNFSPIYYGFDKSFKDYFGERGCEEVRKAMNMLNSLPAMSKVSSNLAEFPTSTRRVNYRASALGIIDLKSYTLAAVVEYLGLTSPERYTFCLRGVDRSIPRYDVIMRNFDPVTWNPTRYVNDTLYTYGIFDDGSLADAYEWTVDPLAFQHKAVADVLGGYWGLSILSYGDYLTGLTRDDIGGLRYLYAGKGRYAVYNMEGLVLDAITNGVTGGGPWTPVGTSIPVVSEALRAGIDKINFKEAKYDSTMGQFVILTNTYKDTYVLDGRKVKQRYQRVLVQPDLIFGAQDMQGTAILRVNPADTWVNNWEMNGDVEINGPGIRQDVNFIIFSKGGPYYINNSISIFAEQLATFNFVWGSFDGSTNEPFVYPQGSTIQDLEARVLGGY